MRLKTLRSRGKSIRNPHQISISRQISDKRLVLRLDSKVEELEASGSILKQTEELEASGSILKQTEELGHLDLF